MARMLTDTTTYKGKFDEKPDDNITAFQGMLDIISQKCEGWFDYMKLSILSEGNSNYNQIIGLNGTILEAMHKSEGALFESMSTAENKEEKNALYSSRPQKQTGPKVKEERVFATTAFLKPSEMLQRIIILLPESGPIDPLGSDGPSKSPVTEFERTNTPGTSRPNTSAASSAGPKMFEWCGIVRKRSHAVRRRELVRQE